MNPARLRGSMGFTLVETLVAMLLVSGVLLPICVWLYKSEAGRAAWEKFHAVQLLEDKMNRAYLLRLDHDLIEETQGPPFLRFDIRVQRGTGETRLLGTARNRKGRVVTTLEADFFQGPEP